MRQQQRPEAYTKRHCPWMLLLTQGQQRHCRQSTKLRRDGTYQLIPSYKRTGHMQDRIEMKNWEQPEMHKLCWTWIEHTYPNQDVSIASNDHIRLVLDLSSDWKLQIKAISTKERLRCYIGNNHETKDDSGH